MPIQAEGRGCRDERVLNCFTPEQRRCCDLWWNVQAEEQEWYVIQMWSLMGFNISRNSFFNISWLHLQSNYSADLLAIPLTFRMEEQLYSYRTIFSFTGSIFKRLTYIMTSGENQLQNKGFLCCTLTWCFMVEDEFRLRWEHFEQKLPL